MPPSGVICDLDGVLVDSYQAHLRSWVTMAREHGLDITEAEFARTFGQTSREVIARYWGRDVDAAALDARKEGLYREAIQACFPVMDGAVALLDALAAAGFRLAVGSSAPPENVALSLRLLGRADAFDATVTGRDVTRGKPNPQVFLLAAERLGLPPARCVVIEDAPVGVAAARAAGMPVIALVGTAEPAALADADLVVASLREVDVATVVRLLPPE